MSSYEVPASPRLVDGVELVHGPGEVVQLRGVNPPVRVAGRLAQKLLPLLDGRQSVEALTVQLGAWPANEVQLALQMLAQRGLLVNGPSGGTGPKQEQAAFYSTAAQVPGDAVLEVLQRSQIYLFGWGSLPDALAESLRSTGCGGVKVEKWAAESFPQPEVLEKRIEGCAGAQLVVLAIPRRAPALLQAANAGALRKGLRLLPVVIHGTEATLGPAVLPGESACYECYTARMLSNHGYPAEETAYEEHLDANPGAPALVAQWAPFTSAVASEAAMEVIRLVTGFTAPVTRGSVGFMNALTGSHRHARVWKLPRCPACSHVSPADQGAEEEGR